MSPVSAMQEEARQEITKLVALYQGLDDKSIKKYSEADTRRVFILPLFKALGWDVSSREEVSEEERVSRGRVDYAFRIGRIPKFFLEAKALRADLDNPQYADQVINYAYHKGVTWAVLTDFEGLKVFNAEVRAADVFQARLFELTYGEYLSRFDQLWLLSREACEHNLLDEEALKWGKKIKKTPVGQQLFSDLVTWRGLLHKHLSFSNQGYTSGEIDEAVQRILDRLMFIRTCEDREIEPPTLHPMLREWQNGAHKDLVRELRQVWHDFNNGYDSRLFQPHIADQLKFAPRELEQVIEGLYQSRDLSVKYDFDAIDADVLGGIYEQYLEHLLKGAGREVEAVPERRKRKAQGIYYTPKFVVRYIVENTLGPALEGKSLNEAKRIRILDPACGSGSFLVEALDFLERHWRRQGWVAEGGEQADFFDYVTRVQFLTDNLYGVDLDAQAVEIAQLNLLLKSAQQRALLPDLKNNIRQGNSLISGTEEELRSYFGNQWEEKHRFNWEEQFKDIMADGGFDVVIGNPPYVQMSMEPTLEHGLKRYLLDTFGLSMGRLNTFGFFIQRGIALLKQGGFLSYIIPNTFLTQEYYGQLRKFVLDNCQVVTVATLEEMPFKAAVVENVITVLRKEGENKLRESNDVSIVELGRNERWYVPQSIFYESFNHAFMIRVSVEVDALRSKIDKHSIKLNKLLNVNQAIALKHDRASCLFNEPHGSEYKKVVDGRDIARYDINWPGTYLLYDVHKIHSCKREDIFLADEKIFFRRVGDRIIAALDAAQHYALNTLVVVTPRAQEVNLRFILALMNSRLLNWYYKLFLKSAKKVFSEIQARQIEQLPLRRIDFDNPADKKMHEDLVALVERMLELNKRLAPIRNTPCNERDELQREIERTDEKIDNLVYDLYGLSKEEKDIVKGECQSS